MRTHPTLFELPRRPHSQVYNAKEFKVVSLRECPAPSDLKLIDNPERVEAYWREHVVQNPYFNPAVECFVVLLLNIRHRCIGHNLVSIGTNDTILVHPREVFRAAIIAAASSIILCHNHPSGDSSPSEADIKVTRDLMRAGQLLKMEVADHVVIGHPNEGRGYTSLRELGYFYS